MAKESVNILKDKIDIVDLLAQLNAALSEEWLAFYQYWVGSFVVEGAMRGDVQREFQEHAASKLLNSQTELTSPLVILPNILWQKKKTMNKICKIT